MYFGSQLPVTNVKSDRKNINGLVIAAAANNKEEVIVVSAIMVVADKQLERAATILGTTNTSSAPHSNRWRLS